VPTAPFYWSICEPLLGPDSVGPDKGCVSEACEKGRRLTAFGDTYAGKVKDDVYEDVCGEKWVRDVWIDEGVPSDIFGVDMAYGPRVCGDDAAFDD
jgi:hypothetical protein